MSQAGPSTQIIPARRPRPEPEIIDVDALPDENILFTRASTSSSNTRDQPIVVYDSDEEVALDLAGHSAIVRRPRPLVRQPSYRDVTRPRHHEPPPAILPNALPLPFEVQMHRPARRSVEHAMHAPLPVPEAAPRSHHQPSMGLGGAIIAMHRQSAREDGHRRHHQQPPPLARRTHVYGPEQAPPQTSSWTGNFVNTIRSLFGHAGRRQHDGEHTWTSYMDDPWPEMDGPWGTVHDVGEPPKSMAVTYQPSYTHPGTPPPGFTYNFGEPEHAGDVASSGKPVIVVDDDGASSSSQPSATLVCARCLDPLVLPGEASPAEEKQRRIWALRCGHMLDGKCIAELMRPRVEVSAHKLGHGMSTDSLSADTQSGKEDALYAPPAFPDRKGKGRAVDRELPASGEQRGIGMTLAPMQPIDDGSIRSRLRPRRNGALPLNPYDLAGHAAASGDVDMEENEDELFMARPMKSLPRRARGAQGTPRSKAKGKARRRSERYHWQCPVADCGHDHISVLAFGDDEYRMDPHKGAVALFL